MSVGIVMLVHRDLKRAQQVARHWAAAGCPVVIHVDKRVEQAPYSELVQSLGAFSAVRFSKRHPCEWGNWGIVAATQDASERMLAQFPQVQHVYLASGACLPLRPVQELVDYLAARPDTDFIESARTSEVSWTTGGLSAERFTLFFPISWKKHRLVFDRFVELQRQLRIKRQIPGGLVPHMGSQWWCLTRKTLSAILSNPLRSQHDRFFRSAWIPDESYFQTLARQHSTKIESRSLTLSKFDFQGKPHIFYDDHLHLLRRSDCFVARKIWPDAQRLYDSFLTDSAATPRNYEPDPGKIDRVFSKAIDRRVRGRKGLNMQSRYPRSNGNTVRTAATYSVFEGFSDVFENFEAWLTKVTAARVHGHLFAPERTQFAQGKTEMCGALTDSTVLRDYSPAGFLSNLIWNTGEERQCFQFGPRDNQTIGNQLARDPNATISVISGAWAVPLSKSGSDFKVTRQQAAQLQKVECDHLEALQSGHAKERIRIWTMAEFIAAPMEPLHHILHEIGQTGLSGVAEVPQLVDLTGFGQFLQDLRNQGMHPCLMGDVPVDLKVERQSLGRAPRPYLVG